MKTSRNFRRGAAFTPLHKFRLGDFVNTKIDPRHVGRVCYTDTTMVRVEWPGPPKCKSDHHHTELEKSPTQ